MLRAGNGRGYRASPTTVVAGMHFEEDKTVGRVGETVRFFVFQHLPRGLYCCAECVVHVFECSSMACAARECETVLVAVLIRTYLVFMCKIWG